MNNIEWTQLRAYLDSCGLSFDDIFTACTEYQSKNVLRDKRADDARDYEAEQISLFPKPPEDML